MSIKIGKLERSNPLPAGVYWIDVIDTPNQIEFAAWMFENGNSAKVLVSEYFPAIGWPDCSILDAGIGNECYPSRQWVKFEVISPVPWNAVRFGFPNVIEPGEVVESSKDTATIPDFSEYCDLPCQAKKVAITAVVAAIGIGLAFSLASRSIR